MDGDAGENRALGSGGGDCGGMKRWEVLCGYQNIAYGA